MKEYNFAKNVFKVIEKILDHPEKRSKTIVHELNITKAQLIEIYRFVAEHKEFQDLLFDYQKYPQNVLPMFGVIRNNKRIEKIIKGQEPFPEIVEIHLGEDCNFNCAMCFSRDTNYMGRELGQSLMDMATIGKLFEEFKIGGVKEIWFSGGKEPLMSPIAFDAIEMANKMGFATRLYTNGELLDSPEKFKKVLSSFQTRISLNVSDAATYSEIHFSTSKSTRQRSGNLIFKKVLKNVLKLLEQKRKTKSKTIIALSFILQPLNHQEIFDFISLAYKLGVDSAQIRTESVGLVRPFTKIEKEKILKQVEKIKLKKEAGFFGNMEIDMRGVTKDELNADKKKNQFLPAIKKARLCRAGSFKRGINPYGDVFACEHSMHPGCERIYQDKKLGSIKNESFASIIKKASGKFPKTCRLCQSFEYGLNISLEKLSDDYQWGIRPEDQPYFVKNE